jgi:REP element-mobilizing transposase RayT
MSALGVLRTPSGINPLTTNTSLDSEISHNSYRFRATNPELALRVRQTKQGSEVPNYPNSYRLRQGRFSEPGRAYFITSVIHQRQPVFADWQIGRLLVAELRKAHDQGCVESITWVVMPDHFHWLVQLQNGTLAEVIGAIKARCTRAVNHKTGREGPLWQSGFHDRAIRDDEDLLPFARYIVANPLRAGLVDKIGDYPLWDACWL